LFELWGGEIVFEQRGFGSEGCGGAEEEKEAFHGA
jgi:hypothetical protein